MSADAQTTAGATYNGGASSPDGVQEARDEVARLRQELDQARRERDALIAHIAAMGGQPPGHVTVAPISADEPVTLRRLPCDGSHPDM